MPTRFSGLAEAGLTGSCLVSTTWIANTTPLRPLVTESQFALDPYASGGRTSTITLIPISSASLKLQEFIAVEFVKNNNAF